ncbi:serine hydrolase [Edaphobacter modestus]|uniref:serine hydrolase n=1 Tax=Edaphobacter modestus TaxID=388466 RepID=UPI0013EEBD5D|nr:serine hydrolase [Edaphobacter modestus]
MTNCLPPPVLVQGEVPECKSLAARMAELKIPGVSVAVVHNGSIAWARGFGVAGPDGKPVIENTLFQAGSMSKPLAAMAALRFVQTSKLSLDADINRALTSWHVPPSSAAPDATVTLRELLSHTAGITVHGFRGYTAGSPVPTLVQVLDGTEPANTPPIRIAKAPGTEWNYSGGGFTVMQQALVDTAHESFPKLMADTVLGPIGMTHSTYEQPLPSSLMADAATAYTEDGLPVPGGALIYPEMAAAGLWTTPSDLAKYILEVQGSLAGKANHVLDSAMTTAMLTPGKNHWGLGIELGGNDANPYFTHGGVNKGFQSLLVAYEKSGDGAIVMTNAVGGAEIANELMRSIAVEYKWPDLQPVTRTLAKVDRSMLERYVGTYMATPTFSVVYTLEGDQLFAQATGQKKFPIFPESESRFFMKVVDAEIEFHTDDKGSVDYLFLHQGGRDYKEMKK